MSRSIPAGDYVEHFNPDLPHYRTAVVGDGLS